MEGQLVPGPRRVRIAFLFIGGAHHLLHAAPVAAELLARGDARVTALADTDEIARALAALMVELGSPSVETQVLKLPAWCRWLAQFRPKWSAMKLLRLLIVWRIAGQYDVIVTPERTSTILKWLPGRKPLMIHIPHGAGDRAKGFERRIKLFDQVLVAGEKDRRRMISGGLTTTATCTATGYIKLGAVQRLSCGRPRRLFKNDRPTILYNPHFDLSLSSWLAYGEEIIAAFRAQGRYNLIVAPHVRLLANASAKARAAFDALALEDRILMDSGSALSNDMTYTQVADLYLGDVSSQVYEFISTPRPCLFLNAHNVVWDGDPDYAFWSFGEVLTSPAGIIAAVDRAFERYAEHRPGQILAAADAMGEPKGSAKRAANAIIETARAAIVIRDLPATSVAVRGVVAK